MCFQSILGSFSDGGDNGTDAEDDEDDDDTEGSGYEPLDE
jgi:hypothetical protein